MRCVLCWAGVCLFLGCAYRDNPHDPTRIDAAPMISSVRDGKVDSLIVVPDTACLGTFADLTMTIYYPGGDSSIQTMSYQFTDQGTHLVVAIDSAGTTTTAPVHVVICE